MAAPDKALDGIIVVLQLQVTTNRSQVDWNAETPCWDFPVNKLDKCGTEITKNLLNVRECAESKGFVPPLNHRINVVRTGTSKLMHNWVSTMYRTNKHVNSAPS